MKANEFVRKFGLDAAKHKADELKIIESMGDKLSFEDENLKRLVESHGLVKEHGSLGRAKEYADSAYTAPEVAERLHAAIADVESCKEVS